MALLTVYTMGDIPIFTNVLNGVAMIFKSSMFDPGQGASIFVLGFMLTILLLIIPATWGGKLNPMPLIFLIFLLYAGTYPKEPLQVEDIYSGTATIVADIPLIISLPASITASVSKKITDVVETAFQTTNGSYLAMGAEGFVNPLKLMLSLRDPHQTIRTFPYLSQSITEFIKYCAATDSTFSTKSLSSSADMIGYLTKLKVSGVMTYWDVNNPMGQGTSCVDGQTRLGKDTSVAKMTAEAENLLKSTTGGDYSKNITGAGASIAGLTQSYNSVTSGILGNMQTGQQFMVNAVAMVPTKQGIDCINQPTGPNMSECMGNVIQREALEKQNIDAAAQAGIFTKTMIPAMNILLLLFYAFAPVIIAYAFLAGPHAIKMLAGYLLFGVWTQSWMPVAAIMNYIIQMQTQYAISAFPKTGFTMENYMQFYSILTMKLGMASTLMASIPMITFGLLSGSAMAMTSVAGSMSAKDYTDESKVAPSVGSNDAAVKNGAMIAGHTKPVELNSSTAAAVGFDVARNGEHDPQDDVNIGDIARSSNAHALSNKKTASKKLDHQMSKQLQLAKSKNQSTEYAEAINKAVGITDSDTASFAKSSSENIAKTHKISSEQRKGVEASFGLMAMGMGAAAKDAMINAVGEDLAGKIMEGSEFKEAKTRSLSNTSSIGFAKNLKTTTATARSNTKTDVMATALTESESADETYQQTDTAEKSIGLTKTLNLQDIAAQGNAEMGFQTIQSAIMSRVKDEDMEKFKRSENAYIARVARTGVKENESIRTAAKLKALSEIDQSGFAKILTEANLISSGQTDKPQGEDVAKMNVTLNKIVEEEKEKVEKATKTVKSDVASADNEKGSGGVNVMAVIGHTQAGESTLREAQDDQRKGQLGKNGEIGKERRKMKADHFKKMDEELSHRPELDENGNITIMAPLKRIVDEHEAMIDAHPTLALAEALLPVGEALSAIKGAQVATEAVVTARAAVATSKAEVKTAESVVRMAERPGVNGGNVVKASESLNKAEVAAENAAKVEKAAVAAANNAKAKQIAAVAKPGAVAGAGVGREVNKNGE